MMDTTTVNEIIAVAIADIILTRSELIKIAVRQKAKFEGWLKFELAHALEEHGMKDVKVETKSASNYSRSDITFQQGDSSYFLELKTCNTNWRSDGIMVGTKPITKNIASVIKDVRKLNSPNGIMAFVLFPIPPEDRRWEAYIDRIIDNTGLAICKTVNCRIVPIQLTAQYHSSLLVCSFMSKSFDVFSAAKQPD